jgi:tetratricopeptide (TPR) repeat protein
MSDSKSNRLAKGIARLLYAALSVVFIATAAPSSFAQSTDSEAPIRLVPLEELIPPSELPAPDAETLVPDTLPDLDDLTPSTTFETLAPPADTAAPTEIDAARVEVGALGEINVDDVGLLAEQSGGFPNALWHGTRRDLVTLLMPRLPIEARSPAMRSAALKLLLSPGTAPRDGTAETGALLRLRADILANMGEFGVAIALLRAAPSGDFEDIIARYDSDRMFLKLDFEAACEQARARIDLSTDSYWQRALIFCQSKNQEHEAASLGLDLLRESGYAPEAAFVTLINGMNGYGEAALNSLPNPSPLVVAMLRNMGIETPRNALDVANPALLRLIASTPDSDIELRLMAAERAEAVGALPAESVGALYAQAAFTAEQRVNPISQSETMSGPLARAMLYQAVLAETVPTARAEVIAIALERAQHETRFPTMARVLLPAMQTVQAGPDFAWFAGKAGRAYFASGHWEEARRWFDVAVAQRSNNPEAQQAAIALWPLIALTGDDSEVDPGMLDVWWQAQGGATDPEAYRRGGLLLTLLASLGRTIAPEQWDVLLAGPLSEPSAVASPALHFALRNASENGRLGETVLLALLGLGAGGPEHAGLSTLAEAIAALRAVGLEKDAQAVAVEAALAGGL